MVRASIVAMDGDARLYMSAPHSLAVEQSERATVTAVKLQCKECARGYSKGTITTVIGILLSI